MEQARGLRVKTAMNHGLLIGVVLILFSFLTNLLDAGANFLMTLLYWGVLIGVIYYSIKTWRDRYLGGFIRYPQALGYGFRTMFFASIIYGFYSMIYMQWINPDIVNENLAAVEEGYYAMGFDDQQIEGFMEMAQGLQTPGWQMFTTIMGTTITGFILSLIVALFVKKEQDPFQSAMNGIKDDEAASNQ